MTVSSSNLVELDAVSFAYPGHDGNAPLVVLDERSLSIGAGRLVCVAGRSGSGKSTMLAIAAGLLLPSSGHVRWQGEPIEVLSEAERARRRRDLIGYVFQSAGLIASLTAAENVALPGAAGRSSGGQVASAAALERVGLGSRARHFPAELSGGEQQRVGVARALFADPPLLIVDEPTANLDRRSADSVIELLAGLVGAERGVLVASHDTALLAHADEVIELE